MFRSAAKSKKRCGGAPMPKMCGMAAPMPLMCDMAAPMPTAQSSSGFFSKSECADMDVAPETPKDLLLQLISLQKALGCWEIGSTLAEVFGKPKEELVKQIPAQVDPGVWATLLALIWLHGFQMDAQVEWQFVAMKAVAWIRTQKVVTLAECVQGGNSLLGCQVTEDALGI